MIVHKFEKFTHLIPDQDSVILFISEFKKKYSIFADNHLIIDFSDKINTTIEELLLFLQISYQHQNNGTSFVLICKGVSIDEFPDEINIVPTYEEALDILEMDAIERDLKF